MKTGRQQFLDRAERAADARPVCVCEHATSWHQRKTGRYRIEWHACEFPGCNCTGFVRTELTVGELRKGRG